MAVRDDEIGLLGEVLGVVLPEAYKVFLREERSESLGWRAILGLPLTSGVDSAWGAAEFIWRARQDLERKVLALQLRSSDALCLDIRNPAEPDPPVLLVSLNGSAPPHLVSSSFSKFLDDAEAADPLAQIAASVASLSAPEAVDALAAHLDLDFPDGLRRALSSPPPARIEHLVYRIGADPLQPPSVFWALTAMRAGVQPPPAHLVPIMPVDERSFACAVCTQSGARRDEEFGLVVRWHLDDVPAHGQRRLLDIDVEQYVAAVDADLRAREAGLATMRELAEQYDRTHEGGQRLPKAHDVRPVRLAVQNVILGLAAFHHDSAFDALSAQAWQSCQAPHVNAHEGCRGLAAVTLTEAFRVGGTMEIRFDRHPERAVPASLRQYGRTLGIPLGAEDKQAITPAEARRLLWAITQMPDDLAGRVSAQTLTRSISPERACFVVLAGIWRPIELDVILGASARAQSILSGGADPFDRVARQSELAVCRAALLIGQLFACLSKASTDGTTSARVVEDDRHRVRWQVFEEEGAVLFENVASGRLPWRQASEPVELGSGQPLIVVPRPYIGTSEIELAEALGRRLGALAATVQPYGTTWSSDDGSGREAARLVSPDGLMELDKAIEARLLACRVGRS